MTPTATTDQSSLHAAPRAAHAQPASPANTPAAVDNGARALSQAIQAVNDHRREVEMRRMALAAQRSAPSGDWLVPVPRARLQALEQQAREAGILRRLLDSGPFGALPYASSATQPHPERHLPPKPNQRPRVEARPASSA